MIITPEELRERAKLERFVRITDIEALELADIVEQWRDQRLAAIERATDDYS